MNCFKVRRGANNEYSDYKSARRLQAAPAEASGASHPARSRKYLWLPNIQQLGSEDEPPYYKDIVEGLLHGIIVQQDGLIVYANPAMARLFGYAESKDLIGRALSRI